MSGKIGGTIEQMTGMGSTFTTEAGEVDRLVNAITSQLGSTDWEGGAAQRFRDQWNGEFRNALVQVAQGLRDCADEVKKRAAALEQVGG